MKEFCRKRLVALKRKPHMIPLIVLALAFIYYSFNLSQISNTTALINGPHMGLAEFGTMLFSTLSLVCFLNAFPHRKKVNVPMLVIMVVMVAIVIYSDVHYAGSISAAINRAENPIDPTGVNSYIGTASNVLRVHIVILCVALGLTALLPVYTKLLRSINTNIEVEGNGGMGAIDISGEDA
jgi:hypothetical protein